MAAAKQSFSGLRHPSGVSGSSNTANSANSAQSTPSLGPVPSTTTGLGHSTLVPSTESTPAPHGPPAVPAKHQVNAPLENLPPEIRRKILSTLDLGSLEALVHASPTFHEQYLLDRRFVLSRCLEVTLRSVTVDACSVYSTSLASFVDTRTREKIVDFFASYQKKRSLPNYSITTEGLSEDEVISIAVFHNSIVQPLARRYVDWALGNVAKNSKQSPSREPLSMAEETRLMRAMYRFQLLCNVFGCGGHGTLPRWKRPGLGYFRYPSGPLEVLRMYSYMFEPWELEEIFCVYAFAHDTYDGVFSDVYLDLDEDSPKLSHIPLPERMSGTFALKAFWETLIVGTAGNGLELLHTVVFEIRDHEHLVAVMREHIMFPKEDFIAGPMDQHIQRDRHEEYPVEGDLKQSRRDPLPFVGDSEPEVNKSDPPLAWTLIWGGTYSNLHGGFLDEFLDEKLRNWGYVMWDATRLESTGAKELVLERWDEYYDPRDSM